MEIGNRKVGEVVIMELAGKLNIGKGDVMLRDTMLVELQRGNHKLLIDLGKVTHIDSSGLGELIRCKVTAAERGAEVKLLHVNLKARKLLTMASLVGVFEMYDDEQLAIASFT
jgi:anti-sigma B factor antagonist